MTRSRASAARGMATLLAGAALCAAALPSAVAPPSAAAATSDSTLAAAQVAAAPSTAASVRAWTGRFARTVESDFRSLPAAENVLWLALGSAATLVAHPQDRGIAARLARHPDLKSAFAAGAWIGSPAVLVPAALAGDAVGRRTGRTQPAAISEEIVRAQIVSDVLAGILKLSVHRRRPDGTEMSFPSGHAATSFATAGVLQERCGARLGLPAFGVASYVAASRLVERHHWLSDVVAGAALGWIGARTVVHYSPTARLALAPAAQGGVLVVVRYPLPPPERAVLRIAR